MKSRPLSRSLIAGLALAAVLFAGMLTGANTAHAITFDWATVGDIGNAADIAGMNDATSGYGSVSYEYRISKHEVTNAQYTEFLNATAATDTFALYNSFMGSLTQGGITRSGSPGSYSYSVKSDAAGQGPGGSDYAYADKPVIFVSWFDSVRFANWLTGGTTESGTYTITGGGANSGTVTVPDHSTLGADMFFLPSEDEWYKAAYFDGSTYLSFATGSHSEPNNNLPSSDTGNSANWNDGGFTTGNPLYPLTDVGDYSLSVSPYGTFDQSGNVWEWNEQRHLTPFDPLLWAGLRGGSWADQLPEKLERVYRDTGSETFHEFGTKGFRIAGSVDPAVSAVPEPTTSTLGILAAGGLLGFLWRRRRRA